VEQNLFLLERFEAMRVEREEEKKIEREERKIEIEEAVREMKRGLLESNEAVREMKRGLLESNEAVREMQHQLMESREKEQLMNEKIERVDGKLAFTLQWASGPCIISFLESRLRKELKIRKNDRTAFRKHLSNSEHSSAFNIKMDVWIAIWERFSVGRNDVVHNEGPSIIAARNAFEKEREVVNSMTKDMQNAIQVLLSLDE
jgi:hypothetical protein